MNTCFYVYLLLDPGNYYIPFYVGKGKSKRWRTHLQNKNPKNQFLHRVIRKIRDKGLEPVVMFWDQNLPEQQALDLEKELIKRFGRRNTKTGILTNLTDGGEGISGKIFSEKERDAISKRTSGSKNGMFGKTHSKEARKIISDRFKGKPGTPHSEEWKQNLRENNAGGKATSKAIYQINSEGNVIKEWPSAMSAAKTLNLSKGNICEVANHRKHHKCGGFWWRWVGSPDVINEILVDYKELQNRLDRPAIRKPLAQIDPKTNKQIKIWNSFQEAASYSNIKYATLWKAVKDNRLVAGYRWTRFFNT